MKKNFILLTAIPFMLLGCRNPGEHVVDSLGPSHQASYRIGEYLKNALIDKGLPCGEFETIKTEEKGGTRKDYYIYNFYSSLKSESIQYEFEGKRYWFSIKVTSYEKDLVTLNSYYEIFKNHSDQDVPESLSSIIVPESNTLGDNPEMEQYGFFAKSTEIIYTMKDTCDILEYKGQFGEYEFDSF